MQQLDLREYTPIHNQPVETQSQEELDGMVYKDLRELAGYLGQLTAGVRSHLSEEATEANKYVRANLPVGVELTFMSKDEKAAFYATEEGKKYAAALKTSNEGWAMAHAAAEHQRQQDALFQTRLQPEDDNSLTPTGLRAQKAGFTVIPGGKKAEAKKTPTIADFFADNSQDKKKSA